MSTTIQNFNTTDTVPIPKPRKRRRGKYFTAERYRKRKAVGEAFVAEAETEVTLTEAEAEVTLGEDEAEGYYDSDDEVTLKEDQAQVPAVSAKQLAAQDWFRQQCELYGNAGPGPAKTKHKIIWKEADPLNPKPQADEWFKYRHEPPVPVDGVLPLRLPGDEFGGLPWCPEIPPVVEKQVKKLQFPSCVLRRASPLPDSTEFDEVLPAFRKRTFPKRAVVKRDRLYRRKKINRGHASLKRAKVRDQTRLKRSTPSRKRKLNAPLLVSLTDDQFQEYIDNCAFQQEELLGDAVVERTWREPNPTEDLDFD